MSEIKLNEITSGTTIKEMVEIINSNFTKIVESGGGPTGVPGEDGVAGPEGKRGNGIFVIKDESEIDEGKEYEKEVNEFLKNDSSDSEEGKYKEGDCIIYKSGLYIVKISPDGDNTLVAEYMGTLKGEKGDKGETGSNEEEGGSSNQWKIVDIHGNHYGYQFNGDYKFLIIGSGIDENKLGSYGAEENYNHSLWILDGEKGIALYGKENEDGTFSKGTITISSDDKLMLTGARGVCVGDLIIDGGDIKHIGDENKDENFLNLICYNGDGTNNRTSIELGESISLNATKSGGNIELNTAGNIEITNGNNHITLTSGINSGINITGTDITIQCPNIVVDKTGVKLSGSGKGINVGIAALKGYDVDIVGTTYISGDLVVGGDYHNIGDVMAINSKYETPEGWFSNYDLDIVKKIPIEYSPNVPMTYEQYQELWDYNDMKKLSEDEFNKYFDICNFIKNEYKDSTNDEKDIIINVGPSNLDTSNGNNFRTYLDYFNDNSDYLKYLYLATIVGDYNQELNKDERKNLKVYDSNRSIFTVGIGNSGGHQGAISVLIFYVFDFHGVYSNDLLNDIENYYTTIINSISGSQSIRELQEMIQQIFKNNSKENVSVTIKKYPKVSQYGSIIITGLEEYYLSSDTDCGKRKSLQVNDDFLLPTYNDDKYYKYIMKYKNNSTETVGIRDNENGE